jgi:DNA-binding beta-propeller fold protein YncE
MVAAVACGLAALFPTAVFADAGGNADDSGLPLAVVVDVPLPGDTSRFDYESYDADRHLLFIAHLGASEVVVFNTLTHQIVGRIGDVRHVHGVLAVPELKRVYASATGTDEVVAIDEDRLAVVARMPGGTYPDGMAYAPEAQKLYVSDETGRTETVIDVRANRRVATIALGGEVGNSQYDPVSKHVFVNVQSLRQLAEIDPASDQVVARTDLPGAKGNHGLLIEPQLRLAFIACEDNDKLIVLDLQSRRIKDAFDVGNDPDVLAYDPSVGLLYVASESGAVSLFKVSPSGMTKVGQGQLAANAHVVGVDPTTHLAYFPIKSLSGHPVLRITKPVLDR